MDDEVGAELQRVLVHRRREGAVHDREGARTVRGLGHGGDVDELELGIGGRLEEDDARALGEHVRQAVHLAHEQERRLDPDLRQVDAEQLEGAAVDVADADDVVTGVGVGQEGGRLRGHARREGEGGFGALQVGQLALHRLDRRVEPVAGVERPGTAAFDDVEQVGRLGESEGGVVVEGRVDGALRVAIVAGVDAASRESPAKVGWRAQDSSQSGLLRCPDSVAMRLPRSPAEVRRRQVPLHLLEVVALEGDLEVVVGAPRRRVATLRGGRKGSAWM